MLTFINMKKHSNNIIHVIKTKSLESDGRLLKWIKSLAEDDITSDVFIIEDNNKKEIISKYNGTIYKKCFLSRRIYKKQKGYPIKIIEYFFRFFPFLFKRKYQIFVFHDVQQYFNILITLLGNNLFWRKKIVWDLHELPHPVLTKNVVSRKVIKYILENVDAVIYTNEERRRYILNNFANIEKDYTILNNFPPKEYIYRDKTSVPIELDYWLKQKNKPYVLWMGTAAKGRNFHVFFEVYKKYSDNYSLVILGNIEKALEKDVGRYIQDGKAFVKFVKQTEIIKYVDNANFSVVLYNDRTPNNYLCEPNRLYQLITRKVPVIVGYNPVLKKYAEEYNAGVVLEDDGSNIEHMADAFEKLIYHKNELYNNQVDFNWEEQFKNIISLIKRI